MQKNISVKPSLDDKFKPVAINPKSLVWNYDTLIAYDTNNALYQRYVRTYNNNGKILTETTANWMLNEWQDGSRDTYTYDANGNNTEIINQICFFNL